MTPTAAASVGARRRRPSPPTDGSHGRAVSKNLGRCAPAGCSATSGRSPETPGSLPSTPGPEGERQWSAASATLRSAPRPHRLRRASMARRSTAACSVCSRRSVQPRWALWDGLHGRRGPPRARWPSSVPTSSMPVGSPISSPAAGPHGALLDGSLLSTPWTVTSASLLLLQPPPGPAPAASLRQCCLRLRDTRVGSPPASPAAGPHGAPLVGSVPSRLCRAVCLTQGAAAAARGRHRRCCREHCRRVRHHRLSSSPISPTPLAARRRPALPRPALGRRRSRRRRYQSRVRRSRGHSRGRGIRNDCRGSLVTPGRRARDRDELRARPGGRKKGLGDRSRAGAHEAYLCTCVKPRVLPKHPVVRALSPRR